MFMNLYPRKLGLTVFTYAYSDQNILKSSIQLGYRRSVDWDKYITSDKNHFESFGTVFELPPFERMSRTSGIRQECGILWPQNQKKRDFWKLLTTVSSFLRLSRTRWRSRKFSSLLSSSCFVLLFKQKLQLVKEDVVVVMSANVKPESFFVR